MHWSMIVVWLVYSVAQLVSIPAGLGVAISTGWSWHCWRQEVYARSGPAARPKAGVQAPRRQGAWVKRRVARVTPAPPTPSRPPGVWVAATARPPGVFPARPPGVHWGPTGTPAAARPGVSSPPPGVWHASGRFAAWPSLSKEKERGLQVWADAVGHGGACQWLLLLRRSRRRITSHALRDVWPAAWMADAALKGLSRKTAEALITSDSSVVFYLCHLAYWICLHETGDLKRAQKLLCPGIIEIEDTAWARRCVRSSRTQKRPFRRRGLILDAESTRVAGDQAFFIGGAAAWASPAFEFAWC